MSKTVIIESEVELREAVRKLFADDLTLSWQWKDGTTDLPKWADGFLEVNIDGRQVRFCVECKLAPTGRDVEKLAVAHQDRNPLLVAPHVSESLMARCRAGGISCADLNGRMWIRANGILIERAPRADRRFRPALPTPDPFSAKSSRLPRALLHHHDRHWTRTELGERTGLSLGLMSRLSRYLINEGILAHSDDGRLIVKQRDALLDAWAAADKWSKRTIIRQYSTPVSEISEMAYRLRTALPQGLRVVFTQSFAARTRRSYAASPILSAYVSGFDDAQMESALNIRRVSEGGTLWLILPNDDGVFRETQTIDRFTIASDAQIYLDLLKAGFGGPDQAKALREWEGFGKR